MMRPLKILLLIVIGLALPFGCKKEDPHAGHDMSGGYPAPAVAVYVANEQEGTVSLIDVIQKKNVYTIHLGETMQNMPMPHNVQVAPDGKTVWVTCMSRATGEIDKIIVIDQPSSRIIRRIDAGVDLHVAHVVFNSTGSEAYVTANSTGQVIVYNTQTLSELRRYNLGVNKKPHGLRYANGKLFVANLDGMSMSIIDVATGQITELPFGAITVQTAVTQDGKYVFASLYDAQQVVRFDRQTQQVTTINLPVDAHGPIQLYATPDSKLLFVCDQGMLNGDPVNNKVYVIDIGTSAVAKIIMAGYAAHGVVISKDGATAYVTNSLSNTVSVIDIASLAVTATIGVGKAPNGISYCFQGGAMP
jgi:YVTN family beta-propeller protein